MPQMRPIRAVLAMLAALLLAWAAQAAERLPAAEWEKATPAQSGWSAAGLAEAQAHSEKIGSTAVMIVHQGRVVGEWGEVAARSNLHSVRKSLLSALVGIAVAEKKIDLSDSMAKLGIDDNAPSLTEIEKQATVLDLLKARSGIYHPALYETEAMAARRPPRGSHAPGSFWYYNNWDFNALGTIYEQAEKRSIYEALKARIADPIGMQDYQPEDGKYFTGVDSIHRAYPIRMSARDLARFALLYLNEGRWKDRQVVPAAWVHESARSYSDAGRGRGYGYLWWTKPAVLPEGSFYAAGNHGQYAFVVPSRELVIVHRVNTEGNWREPSTEQMGQLLKLILAAAPK